MAAARNVIIFKKRWEIGLAQTQVGGGVKEQMAGPPGKDGCRAQCNNIKMAAV
jgi:hypothetical protein